MNERLGVGVAVLSTAIGGGVAVVRRYLIGGANPIMLAALRFSGDFPCRLPLALLLRVRWPFFNLALAGSPRIVRRIHV